MPPPGRIRLGLFLGFFGLLGVGLVVVSFKLSRNDRYLSREGLVYSTANGIPLHADIYRNPARQGIQPAVVILHGGGWARGDRQEMGRFAALIAREGITGICIDYRLAGNGTHHFPAALEDLEAALRWVGREAETLRIDLESLGLAGASAGAHLATLYALTQHLDPDRPRVRAVVDLFGPTDLAGEFSPGVTAMITNFLGVAAVDDPELYRAASPIHHVTSNAPPFLISQGGRDEFVPAGQSEALHRALRAAGVESRYLYFPKEKHGLYGRKNLRSFLDASRAFLREHLRPRDGRGLSPP